MIQTGSEFIESSRSKIALHITQLSRMQPDSSGRSEDNVDS